MGNKALTTEHVIAKFKIVHGDRYDYSLVEYISSRTKVIITCSIHGDFEQRIDSHLKGSGCPKCNTSKSTTETFINKANIVHNNFYNYDKVVYKYSNEKVIIICPIHGDFEQLPNSHLQSHGCPECSISVKLTTETFINKANIVHNNFYNYDKVVYIKNSIKVIITCLVHGDFEQTPDKHLQGRGCPKCKHFRSSQEIEICEFLQSHGIEFIHSDRTIINPYELDIVIPSKKIAIEFNGTYWHSDEKISIRTNGKYKTADEYHNMKTYRCKSKGYDLFHIDENDWMFDKQNELNKILDFYHRV